MEKLERDAEICKRYEAGESTSVLEADYNVTRQWIHKILKQHNVKIRPRGSIKRTTRDTFLGANINSDTKTAVEKLAFKRNTSVSELTEKALQEMVNRADHE